LQPLCFRAATIFPTRSSITEQRTRSSANEQRVTASSASSSVVDDGEQEQEQTSAPTVLPIIVERVTVRVLSYIDDIFVIYSVEQLP